MLQKRGFTPTSPDDWLMKGNVSYLSGDYTGAIEAYNKAMALYPDNIVVKTNKAIAERKLHPKETGTAAMPPAGPAPVRVEAPEGGIFQKIRSWLNM
jgi:tetratricopeptide (TPR) repeat protein